MGPVGTNFNEILIGIQTFSFKNMQLNTSSAKWRTFCLGLDVLIFAANQKEFVTNITMQTMISVNSVCNKDEM